MDWLPALPLISLSASVMLHILQQVSYTPTHIHHQASIHPLRSAVAVGPGSTSLSEPWMPSGSPSAAFVSCLPHETQQRCRGRSPVILLLPNASEQGCRAAFLRLGEQEVAESECFGVNNVVGTAMMALGRISSSGCVLWHFMDSWREMNEACSPLRRCYARC